MEAEGMERLNRVRDIVNKYPDDITADDCIIGLLDLSHLAQLIRDEHSKKLFEAKRAADKAHRSEGFYKKIWDGPKL